MPRTLAAAAAALALLHGAASAAPGELAPLFVVPGVTGSALEVRLNGSTPMPYFWCPSNSSGAWLSTWPPDPVMMAPGGKDCLFKRLSLTYDPATGTFGNLPGIDLRPVGMDASPAASLLYKYEYGSLFDLLGKAVGYEVGRDLFVAPYDWRLAADSHARSENGIGGFFEELRLSIETAVSANQGRKVVVLTHSLGALNILYFFHNHVSEEWRAEHIESWVSLAGPWMGTPMMIETYLGGVPLGLPAWLVPPDYAKPLEVNTSSGLWLAPQPAAFGDSPLVITPSRNYTASDFPAIISAIGESISSSASVAILGRPSMDLLPLQKAPRNVPVLNWYSLGTPTPVQYVYDSDIAEGFNQPPKATQSTDGDGTVTKGSLQWPEQHWPEDPTAPVTSKVFPSVSHTGILNDDGFHAALADYLGSLAGPRVFV